MNNVKELTIDMCVAWIVISLMLYIFMLCKYFYLYMTIQFIVIKFSMKEKTYALLLNALHLIIKI